MKEAGNELIRLKKKFEALKEITFEMKNIKETIYQNQEHMISEL